MHRTTLALFVVVLLAAVATLLGGPIAPPRTAAEPGGVSVSASSTASADAARLDAGRQGAPEAASDALGAGARGVGPELAPSAPSFPQSPFWSLPDGSPVPALPATAPKRVRFGVALVRYRGAELAPSSAPPRDEAREHARRLVAIGRTSFELAVRQGDPGSVDDAGWIRRGELEPSVEYVLFTLAPGRVADEPVDTPRGFWVVRRLE